MMGTKIRVTPADVTENQPMLDLLFRTRFRWRARVRRVTGDAKYGTKENIAAGGSGRVLMRSCDEEILERVRAYRQTGPYEKALSKRKAWVEPMFAEAKEWHGMKRFRLRRRW